MPITTVEVNKNPNENNVSLLRRFTRKVQESGILPRVKSIRYNQRELSKLKTKELTLKKIAKRKDIEKKKKMGKM